MTTGLAIGVDVGGTKTAAALVDADGRVLERLRADTRGSDPAAVVDTVADLVGRLAAGREVVAVGVGAAGFVDAEGELVRFAPHLAWRGEPLRETLAGRTGLPVRLENDANAAAWAEWRFGAAAGESHVVFVALGTGIGGALVLDGRVHRGRFGHAGEFGHTRVVPDGIACDCGNRGCWEQYASGRVLTRRGRRAAEEGGPLGQRLLEAAGGQVAAIEGAHVTAAARAGDPEAVGWFAELGEWLGVGVANLVAALDPGVVVIGGGLSEAGDLLVLPAREVFSRSLTGRGHRPEPNVVAADLGADAGVIGAADLARAGLGS